MIRSHCSFVNSYRFMPLASHNLLYCATFIFQTSPNVEPRYLGFHFKLEETKKRIRNVAVGQTMASLNTKIMKSFPVALPPDKSEQEKISHALSEIDDLIFESEQLVKKYRTIKQGCLQRMLPRVGRTEPEMRLPGFSDPWEERSLGNQMYIKSRIGWQALTKDEYLDTGDYYLITGTDIDEDTHTVDLRRCCYVSKERYDMDDKIQVREGDIIVTKDGTIGKVAMVTGLDKPATLNSHLFVLRDLSGTLDNRFLLQVLSSHLFDAFVENTKTGTTLTGLPQKTFVGFKFFAPKYDEQRQISEVLADFDQTIMSHQRKCEKYKMIKQRMMEELLTGKIRLV